MAEPAQPVTDPDFGALLERLRMAHERELGQLKRENDALRAQARAAPEKVFSQWRAGLSPKSLMEAMALRDAFQTVPVHEPSPTAKQPPKPSLPSDEFDSAISPAVADGAQDNRVLSPDSEERVESPDSDERVESPDTNGAGLPKARGSRNSRGSRGSKDGDDRPALKGTKSTKSSRSIANRIFEDMVPQSINFQMLCVESYPDKQWFQLTSHQKVGLIREALTPRHRVISPHCKFMKYWDLVMCAALTFVGLFTPYEVVFLTGLNWPFFAVNRFVDLLFLIDMTLSFFVGVVIHRPHRGGTVILRDLWSIRRRYLRSWFVIDVLSIFPFDVLSLVLASTSSFFQRAKILRCLKLLRLAKLLRILHSSKLAERWRQHLNVQFATQKLLKFTGVLCLVSHWMACVWGLTGLTFGAELCDEKGQQVVLSSGSLGLGDVSWMTTLYLGGKTSPDSPCNHFEIYAASLHWAVMTLTSIGYGDIVPVRVEEYIIGIICMVCGGVMWAYVIGSVCCLLTNSSPVDRHFEEHTDLLNLAMHDAGVPNAERHKFREFLREAKAYERRVSFNKIAAGFSPMLRRDLMYRVSQDALGAVYYFNDRDAPPRFLMDVASALKPHFFSRGEALDSLRHCLCMLDRGTVAHGGLILVPPGVFHEDFIITQKKYHKVTRTVSLTFTQVLVLTREDMEQMLECHPKFQRKLRRVATKTAFIRAVHMTVVAYRKWRAAVPEGTELSLTEAFDAACGDEAFALPGTKFFRSTIAETENLPMPREFSGSLAGDM